MYVLALLTKSGHLCYTFLGKGEKMEEKKSVWQEIAKKAGEIKRQQEEIDNKIKVLKQESKALDREERKMLSSVVQNGEIRVLAGDFEKALKELDPQHKTHSVFVEWDEVDQMSPRLFNSPQSLKDAKHYKGTFNYITGMLELYRDDHWPICCLTRCYLSEKAEKLENPTRQDLILCFHPETVRGNSFLISVFAEIEKLHEKENDAESELEF